MMEPINIFYEIGKKRVYAGAVAWYGWYGSGRDEASALQALLDLGPRYGAAIEAAQLGFQPPTDLQAFNIIERVEGNSTTDFGAPDVPPTSDDEPVDEVELQQMQALMSACWDTLLRTAQQAVGQELRKGPRGGGRELNGIVTHVANAHTSYLRRIAWQIKLPADETMERQLAHLQYETSQALTAAVVNGLPEKSKRGGKIWQPRTFVRRAAWHILEHIWEIEDRVLE
ncbi:MAG: hypothetical protein KDE31_35625 [Caldilineaceae bacterium]|nr:hypothetical protein [Caldilineaceae bacterium]